MKLMAVAAIIIALSSTAPVLACEQPIAGATAVPGASPEIEQLSQRFAQLYAPIDLAVDSAMRLGASEFRRGVEQGEGGAAWIVENPDLYRHLESAALAVLRGCLERRGPDVQVLIANFAQTNLSANHLRRIIAFFESDGGRAIMQAATTSARPIDGLVDAEGNVREVTAEDMSRIGEQIPITALTRQQQIAIGLFSRTPAGLRMEALGPQFGGIIASSVNAINAQSGPLMEQAVIDGLAEWGARNQRQVKESGAPK